MKTKKPDFGRISIVVMFALAAVVFATPARVLAQSTHDNYIYEDEGFLDRLQDVKNTNTSPFADVPLDHWAYKAVKRLADTGILSGYKGELFRGDQVVTRYEMAMVVAKLMDGYLEWNRSGGRITREEYTTVNKPADDGRPYPYTGAPLRAISPPSAVIAPTRRVSVDLPSLGSMALDKSQPKLAGDGTVTDANEVKTLTEDEVADIARRVVKEEIPFTKKDIDTLQKLVNEFKGELKSIKKDLSKEIKETNRIALQNKKDIKSLEDEDNRFKITGKNTFFWLTEGPITGDECFIKISSNQKVLDETNKRCNYRTANLANRLDLDFKSKPDKDADLTVGGTLTANTYLGGKRIMRGDKKKAPGDDEIDPGAYGYWEQQARAQYKGYLEGTNTALSLTDIFVNYNGKNYAQKPRNLWLKSLYLGNFSAPLASPMTVFGNKLQGLTSEIMLNKFSITLFGARERLHQHEPFIIPDNSNTDWKYNTIFFNEDQFDRYKYGISIGTSIFDEPTSMLKLNRVFMYDDKDTNYPGCETGKWMNLSFAYDEYTPKKPDTDVGSTDLFCLPPVKNSVSSVFLMYPVYKNVNMMAEYAHSTYYKPYYRLLKPFDTFKSSSNPSGVDVNKIGDKYVKWWESREESDQDDGYLVFFNYAKGPLSIFPIGKLHLGPNFQADLMDNIGEMMGGGGFDLSSVSFLPISIKSIDGLLGSVKYDLQGKEKISSTYVTMKENKPMYFDPGALSVGFNNNSSKETILSVLGTAITRLNNRKSKLELNVWSTSWQHYLSDKISFTASYTKIGALLPTSCLDANVSTLKNDMGDIVDKTIGNGIANCTLDPDDINFGLKFWSNIQTYDIDWTTSKRTTTRTSFKIIDMDLTMKFTPAVEDIINNLAPKGQYYVLSEDVKYKLTNSTRLRFTYQNWFDRYPYGTDVYEAARPSAYKFPIIDSQKFLFTVETNF